MSYTVSNHNFIKCMSCGLVLHGPDPSLISILPQNLKLGLMILTKIKCDCVPISNIGGGNGSGCTRLSKAAHTRYISSAGIITEYMYIYTCMFTVYT